MPEAAPSEQQSGLASGQEQESCRSCLYTGVGTCVGLSGYFLYLAMEDDEGPMARKRNMHEKRPGERSRNAEDSARRNGAPRSKTPQSTNIQRSLMEFMKGSPAPKNRLFLFGVSAMWAVAGAYRLYLN